MQEDLLKRDAQKYLLHCNSCNLLKVSDYSCSLKCRAQKSIPWPQRTITGEMEPSCFPITVFMLKLKIQNSNITHSGLLTLFSAAKDYTEKKNSIASAIVTMTAMTTTTTMMIMMMKTCCKYHNKLISSKCALAFISLLCLLWDRARNNYI